METKLAGKEKRSSGNVNLNHYHHKRTIDQAKSDLESLERSYRKSSRTLQSMVVGLIFAMLVFMAYGLFGGRADREKFTTDVTPIHRELNAISGHRQTAENPQNLQL